MESDENSAVKGARSHSLEPSSSHDQKDALSRPQPSSRFRPYTIKFDFDGFMQEEDEDVWLFGKNISCLPNGVVALTRHDGKSQLHLYFFNMHTRCEISRIELPDRIDVRYLHAIDEKTIVAVGNQFIFEERVVNRVEPKIFALLFTSDDGFRTVITTRVELVLQSSSRPRFPDFCVTVGNGFVFMMRDLDEMYRKPMDFFYVPFRELCIVGASVEHPKSITASAVGSMKALGEGRLVAIPYNDTSFGVLKRDMGKKRIDVYDINTRRLSRRIPVHWYLETDFPPNVAHGIIFNGKRSTLLQEENGEKLILNLELGTIESIAPFIPPRGDSLDLYKYALWNEEESSAESELESEDDFNAVQLDRRTTLVEDALYLTAGWTIVDDTMAMGWIATEIIDDSSLLSNRRLLPGFSENFEEDKYSSDGITLMRFPLDKVHTLATLAEDAVNRLFSKEIRRQITREANPKSVAEYVNAIMALSTN